jgi:hypothetical protein
MLNTMFDQLMRMHILALLFEKYDLARTCKYGNGMQKPGETAGLLQMHRDSSLNTGCMAIRTVFKCH